MPYRYSEETYPSRQGRVDQAAFAGRAALVPGQELVDAVDGMTFGNPVEHIAQVGLGVDGLYPNLEEIQGLRSAHVAAASRRVPLPIAKARALPAQSAAPLSMRRGWLCPAEGRPVGGGEAQERRHPGRAGDR